jgi:transposase-like protein
MAMSEQERADRVAEMRERGATLEAIGRELGFSAGNINWICLKYGIEGPRKKKLGDRGPLVVRRGNHEVRRFTPEEDAKITAMELAGKKRVDIARELKRKPNSILGRQMTLARRAERAMEEGQ